MSKSEEQNKVIHLVYLKTKITSWSVIAQKYEENAHKICEQNKIRCLKQLLYI